MTNTNITNTNNIHTFHTFSPDVLAVQVLANTDVAQSGGHGGDHGHARVEGGRPRLVGIGGGRVCRCNERNDGYVIGLGQVGLFVWLCCSLPCCGC